jgi:hypothetical protein
VPQTDAHSAFPGFEPLDCVTVFLDSIWSQLELSLARSWVTGFTQEDFSHLYSIVSVCCFLYQGRVFNMIKPDNQKVSQKRTGIREQLNSLQQDEEMLHNMLAVDVWALAKTMDEFQPGFWSAFMKNREKALKRFISETVKDKSVTPKRPPFLR